MSNIPNDKIIDKMETLLNVASDFTRLKILYAIKDSRKSVSQIVNLVDASQSLISHQLSVLKKNNLVSSEKDGTSVYYKLTDDHVVKLISIVYEHVLESEKEGK